MARQENPAALRLELLEANEKFDTVHARHQAIGNRYIDAVFGGEPLRFFGQLKTMHVVIGFEFEQGLDRLCNRLFVVHNQNRRLRILLHGLTPCVAHGLQYFAVPFSTSTLAIEWPIRAKFHCSTSFRKRRTSVENIADVISVLSERRS